MGFKPLGNRILVKIIKTKMSEAKMSKGGIHLPETSTKNNSGIPMHGIVVEVGEGTWTPKGIHIPVCFSKGQTVVFGKMDGHPVSVDNEEHLLIAENNIVGTLSPVGEDWSPYEDIPMTSKDGTGGDDIDMV
jgi:chaperonin GroES